VVALAVDPSGQAHGGPGVGQPKGAAGVGAIGVHGVFSVEAPPGANLADAVKRETADRPCMPRNVKLAHNLSRIARTVTHRPDRTVPPALIDENLFSR
jgi:hypothetical protein